MEDFVRSANLPLSVVPNVRRPASAQDWEDQRTRFEHLYVTERRGLKEVMEIMKQDYGFLATSILSYSRPFPPKPVAPTVN